jgi:hypothetical protein
MTMVRVAIDHLFPPDPGSLRLLAALRATLAGVLTLLLVLLLGMFVVAPITDRILGFAIALFIAATVRDNDIRQKLVTISLGGLAAFASTALAALLLDQPFAAAAVVPVLMFVVVYSSIRGPRYASIGTVTLIGYIVGLVTRQPPETLPTRLLVIVLAAGVAALIHGVLLPERPLAELNRLRRAVRARIANVLDRIAAAVAAGAWTVALRAELEREIARLSETVMLAQARVARLATQLPGQGIPWLHLLEMDVAVERVSRCKTWGLQRSGLLCWRTSRRCERRRIGRCRSRRGRGRSVRPSICSGAYGAIFHTSSWRMRPLRRRRPRTSGGAQRCRPRSPPPWRSSVASWCLRVDGTGPRSQPS